MLTEEETVTVNGRSFVTTFDSSQSEVVATSAEGRTTVTELNDTGRPTQVSMTGHYPINFTYYSGLGPHWNRLHTISQGEGGEERTYVLSYDDEGNLASIAAPLGKTVSFTHDASGRVTSKTFPDGEKVRFEYDPSGNIVAIAQPGSPRYYYYPDVHSFGHGPLDQLTLYNPPVVAAAGPWDLP